MMKRRLMTLVVCLLLSIQAFSQANYKKIVDDFVRIKEIRYNAQISTDKYYLLALKQKMNIVPYLFERANDTTSLTVQPVYHSGNYKVGDICILVLSDLFKDLKTEYLIDSLDNTGVTSLFYVSQSLENRKRFTTLVKSWFDTNKDRFTWIIDNKLYRISEDEFNNRKIKNPIGGYYLIKK